MPPKIVFMGTPEFSVPTLDLLIKNKFNVVKVYTQPPKKSKRGQKIILPMRKDVCQYQVNSPKLIGQTNAI